MYGAGSRSWGQGCYGGGKSFRGISASSFGHALDRIKYGEVVEVRRGYVFSLGE